MTTTPEVQEAIRAAIASLEESRIAIGMFRSMPEIAGQAERDRAAIDRHIAVLEALLTTAPSQGAGKP